MSKGQKSILENFDLMLPSTKIEDSVTYTNSRIRETMASLPQEKLLNFKNTHIGLTDKVELITALIFFYSSISN